MQAKMNILLSLRKEFLPLHTLMAFVFGFAGTEAHGGVGGGKEAFFSLFTLIQRTRGPMAFPTHARIPTFGSIHINQVIS